MNCKNYFATLLFPILLTTSPLYTAQQITLINNLNLTTDACNPISQINLQDQVVYQQCPQNTYLETCPYMLLRLKIVQEYIKNIKNAPLVPLDICHLIKLFSSECKIITKDNDSNCLTHIKPLFANVSDNNIEVWNMKRKKKIYMLKAGIPKYISPTMRYNIRSITSAFQNVFDQYSSIIPEIQMLKWSFCGIFLVVVYTNETIKIFNFHAKEKPFLELKDTKKIHSIAWNPYHQYLAIGSNKGIVSIWDINRKQCMIRIEYSDPISIVSWNHDGRLLAFISGSSVFLLSLFEEWSSFIPIQQVPITGNNVPEDIKWSPEDNKLAILYSDLTDYYQKILVYNCENERIRDFVTKNKYFKKIYWSCDGQLVYINQKKVNILNIKNREIFEIKEKSDKEIFTMDVSRRYLATGTAREVTVWDLQRYKSLDTFLFPKAPIQIKWNREGNMLAVQTANINGKDLAIIEKKDKKWVCNEINTKKIGMFCWKN